MKSIDLRSDTVTHPTEDMRKAMAIAEVGDDVYQDDPTVIELETYAAQLVGKEAALFVPSGTMGNQLCLMTHTKRGDEIVTGANNHIVVHEVGSVAVLSQANLRTITHPDDFILPNDFLKAIRSNDIHEPQTTVLSMENALSNGKVMPLDLMRQNYAIAKEHNIKVHLDGARLFNASTYLNCDPKELTQYCDSVMFCLSKGLCAPIGSMIAGSREFIERARKNRKLLGGGMRQAGILAAAGLIALKDMTKRLNIDHDNARYLGQELQKTGLFKIQLENIHINMVFFEVIDPNFDYSAFEAYLAEHHVKINANYNGYRFVTHYWITREDIDTLITLIKNYAKN